MKITRQQLRRIIKEKRALLKEQGDPIADVMLGDFLTDVAQGLTDSYDSRDAHWIGTEDEFQE